MRGWTGNTSGRGSVAQQLDELLEANRIVDRAGTVGGDEQVRARLERELAEDARALLRNASERERHVGHHVPHEVHLPGDALALEVRHGRFG